MCKFSLIIFLHLANTERVKEFIFRGEFRCLATTTRTWLHRISQTLKKIKTRKKHQKVETPADGDLDDPELAVGKLSSLGTPDHTASSISSKLKKTRMWDTIGMVLCCCLILLSMRVLVLKLTLVYFAGIFYWTEWNYKEWLLFLGFLNQLSGLALSGEVEMLRILLFKFGGEESKWDAETIEACDTYFHYLAYRTIEQLGRFRGIVLLFSLNSAQLQGLFQGHMRRKEQQAVRGKEIEMFQRLHDREALMEMRNELLTGFGNMLDDHDRLLREASKETKMEVLNLCQTQAVGGLRLAAKAQEFIWEWEKVLLLEKAPVHDQGIVVDTPATAKGGTANSSTRSTFSELLQSDSTPMYASTPQDSLRSKIEEALADVAGQSIDLSKAKANETSESPETPSSPKNQRMPLDNASPNSCKETEGASEERPAHRLDEKSQDDPIDLSQIGESDLQLPAAADEIGC
jgi:hypothetical protein